MEGMVFAAAIGQSLDVLLLVAAVLGALAFLLFKVIVPGAKGITTFNEDIAPNVQYMPNLAKLDPVLTVLEEIAAQFRTDSGSTLKDTTNRLEAHAEDAKAAVLGAREAAVEAARVNRDSITALEIAVGTMRELMTDARELARADRDLARDAYDKVLSLLAAASRTEQSGARIEASRAVVAEDLAAQQKRADDVADSEPPGAAADAASQSPEDPDDSR